MRRYHVYILASRSRRLYTGVTNSLIDRVFQHRRGLCVYTARYRIYRLVYCCEFPTVIEAIAAEKRIKAWTRAKRVALIESLNPDWNDLAEHVLGTAPRADPSLRSG